MKKDRLIRAYPGCILVALFFLCSLIFLPAISNGQETKKDLPARQISAAPEYPSITVPQGQDVNTDVNVRNGGRRGETIFLTVTSVPKGWKAWFKTYSFTIGGVYVQSNNTKDVSFKAVPDKSVGPGEYRFPIRARTSDGLLTSTSELIIHVETKKAAKVSKAVKITTSYPVLKGPTGVKFEFSLDVQNETDKDAIFNLSYDAPKDWEVNFKPAYEDKYFSSLMIKRGLSKSMSVQVKPSPLATPGEYPIKVMIASDRGKGEATLKVVLTGTYKLNAGTANGLLSLTAYQGKPANMSFYVSNDGSAEQDGIKFLTFKPENWKVKFSPKNIEALPAGQLKQVEMTITPSGQALVGDYSVGVTVQGEKASKNLEFRTTVRASSAWSWIGIIIIIGVLAGLVFLFVRMGRR